MASSSKRHSRRKSSSISVHELPDIVKECRRLTKMPSEQQFENTSTSVAASQMRNALNALADSVKDPSEKQVSSLDRYGR